MENKAQHSTPLRSEEGGRGEAEGAEKKCAVFFDRDGTLNIDIHYLHRPQDFLWTPDAREAIKYVNDKGFLAILITNQSGVARGYYPEHAVRDLYGWMNGELAKIGAHLDALYYCPHHPEARLPQYRKKCSCRKPAPGLVNQACEAYAIDKEKSCFIGDTETDMLCAKNAGIRGICYTGGSLFELLQEKL